MYIKLANRRIANKKADENQVGKNEVLSIPKKSGIVTDLIKQNCIEKYITDKTDHTLC